MPSTSRAQARLMAAVAHGWQKPGGGGPPRTVAKEFNQADAAHPGRMEKLRQRAPMRK